MTNMNTKQSFSVMWNRQESKEESKDSKEEEKKEEEEDDDGLGLLGFS